MEVEKTIELLKAQLKALGEDPSVKKFYGGTFRAWAQDVDAILLRGLGNRGTRLRVQFYEATRDLPLPRGMIDPGGSDKRFQFLFESKLPEVDAVLKRIIRELEESGLPDSRTRYELTSPIYWAERFWRWKPVSSVIGWVKTNRLLSTLITAIIGGIIATLILVALGVI